VVTDRILFGYKAPALHDPDHLRLELLSELLIGGPSSPIYRDLVIEREIFSSLGGSVTPFRDPGLWEIAASLHRGHSADEGLSQFDAHIAKVVAQGPSQAEVDRARARMLTSFYLSLKTAHGKASSLGESQTTLGDYRELWRVPQILRAITVEELHAVAQRYLRPEQRTVVIAEPSGEPIDEDEADGDEESEA